MEEEVFEVLFELGGSRKPLSVQRNDLISIVECELASIVGDACMVPFALLPSDVPTTSKKILYLLQRWSVKWQAFVDVKSADELQDGDRLTAVPAFSGNPTSTPAMKLSSFLYNIQWNLRTRDTLGITLLSLVERLSLSQRFIFSPF